MFTSQLESDEDDWEENFSIFPCTTERQHFTPKNEFRKPTSSQASPYPLRQIRLLTILYSNYTHTVPYGRGGPVLLGRLTLASSFELLIFYSS